MPVPPSRGPSARLLGTATGMLFALGAPAVRAQSASDQEHPPRKPPEKETARNLDKVDVFGAEQSLSSPKFTAPLVDTPQSVTILPRALLQATAATSLEDALRNVPGITFAAGEGGNPVGDRPSIRGFNSTANTYVDGMRDIGIQTRDVFDLEQIEVVKGPDSSIAGRAGGGGSINLVSKSAQLENFIEAAQTYGSARQHRTTLDANGQMGAHTAARINILDEGGGVPGRDHAVRADKFGFAPTITFGLSTPTRVTLSWYHLQDQGTPDYGVPVNLATGRPSSEDVAGVSRRNFYGLADRDFRHATINVLSAAVEHTFNDDFSLRTQVRGARNVNNYTVTSPDDAFGNTTNGLVYRLPIGRRAKDTSMIGQSDLFGHFDTGSVHHDIDAGMELSQEKLRQAGDGNYNGYLYTSSAGPQGFGNENCYLPGDPNYDALQASHDCTSLYRPNPHDDWQGTTAPHPTQAYYTTHDVAAYAFDTITLSPMWKLNGGLRWDNYNSRSRHPGTTDPGTADHLTFLSYQASAIFKPTENGSIYLTRSTAALPLDLVFSDQDQSTPGSDYQPSTRSNKPVRITTLELGSKWNLFDNRLLLSGDVFEENSRNTPISTAPDIFTRGGKTRSRGVELSANGSITEAWNVIAGYSHINATLKNGAYYDGAVGKQLVDTPRNTFSLFSSYQVTPTINLGGGAYYRDQQVGYYGPPDRIIPSYWRVDALGSWAVTPHLALQLNLDNLLNRRYYTKSYYQFALPAAGRTWMLTARVRF